ncbi:MAG: zinc ribbon domain-containing protein [Kiritimatiellae bacterium]|nr:zinc ribbon domain-containing protein [Kiritimatiellia bacterium]
MPIYEYACGKCKSHFEHFARSLSDQPKKCPECGSKRVTKQFSSFATTKTFQLASGHSKSSKAPAKAAASPAASPATCPAAKSSKAAACPAAGSCEKSSCGAK